MSTPSSQIYICSGVRLTNDYKHTIWFDSLSEQLAFFQSKVVHGFPSYTYLRKTWNIKVQANAEDAESWTYLFFTNRPGGRTYFYFINRIEYINDNTVELYLEMDVMQTYLFDYDMTPCFVEREHTASDSIGSNLVEEDLEFGEYTVVGSHDVELADTSIMMLCTSNPEVAAEATTELVLEFAAMYNGVFSGLSVYRVSTSKATALGTLLSKLDDAGNKDCIVAMWMYPTALIKYNDGDLIQKVTGKDDVFQEITRNTTMGGGYYPRNKKLLSYPYSFLYVTNNCGGAAVYHYDLFGTSGVVETCNFKIVGSISPDAAVRCYPLNYRNQQHAFEEGLSLSNFPSCAWDSDMYKLWLAQNQNQLQTSQTLTLMKGLGGLVSTGAALVSANVPGLMAGAGMMYSAATDVAQQMAMRKDKAIQPEQARGNYSSTVNTAAGFQTFTFKKKTLTEAAAKRLDDYFDMYGYRTLEVKVPNRNVRENWTYTKTIGAKVRGSFPVEDKVKIESIYNSGVTFWKNGNSVGNYSLSNNCL